MGHTNKPAEKKKAFKEKMKLKRKENKEHSKEKRARLIIKNLSFNVTEETLREHYEKYGKVKDVTLLKREDGKLVGCGFVQYEAVTQAAKARFHTNGMELLGRKINCDFAISKDRYLKNVKEERKLQNQVAIKEEPMDVDLSLVKDEKSDETAINAEEKTVDNIENSEIKVDTEENEATSDGEVKEDEATSDDDDNEDEATSDDDQETSESEFEENENKDQQSKSGIKPPTFEKKQPHVISNDVNEGKTVFIKNVPFDATNDDLRMCMQQFGQIYYALICMDPMTEHSKGTGFVKFKFKEDAEKCLQAGTELTLLGNILDCHPALNRNDVKNKSVNKEDKRKGDSRNLYLVKEGVILAGSKAAEGVSTTDMAKRLQLEQYKTQMLRNLNMFVSRNRLIIHNLPTSWDDVKLRALVKKHAGQKAFIREAKIMRNMKTVDSTGAGQSKEHGFVTLATHEDAINVLRSLNNNPNIFTPAKRPIVAFSIENRVMVNAKVKRLERSRQRNPLSKDFDPSIKARVESTGPSVRESKEFSGVAASPGVKKMRSRYNLKNQAQMHHENLKKAKLKKKLTKKTLEEKKKDFIKQPKQKINKKQAEPDNFSKMVNDYKTKLSAAISSKGSKKTKWYE